MSDGLFGKLFANVYLFGATNVITVVILGIPHPIPYIISVTAGMLLLISGMSLEMYNIVKQISGKYKPYLLAIVFGVMMGLGLWLVLPNSAIEESSIYKLYKLLFSNSSLVR